MISWGAPGLDSETREPEHNAVGFVLAGGQSARMGADKALVEFRGRPLIAHALDILAAAGVPAFIAGARTESAARLNAYASVIPDIEPGRGPLTGVCSALTSTVAEWAVFLPVDVPLLPASLVACLLRHARITHAPVTLVAVNGFPQTFPAVVPRRALPVLQRELRDGRLGCFAAFQAAARELDKPASILPAEILAQCGQVLHPGALPVAQWFFNLNTQRDLAAAASRPISRVS